MLFFIICDVMLVRDRFYFQFILFVRRFLLHFSFQPQNRKDVKCVLKLITFINHIWIELNWCEVSISWKEQNKNIYHLLKGELKRNWLSNIFWAFDNLEFSHNLLAWISKFVSRLPELLWVKFIITLSNNKNHEKNAFSVWRHSW